MTQYQPRTLEQARVNLKNGEYDGVDVMLGWIAIEELLKLREWRDIAFEVHPNLDLDVEAFSKK